MVKYSRTQSVAIAVPAYTGIDSAVDASKINDTASAFGKGALKHAISAAKSPVEMLGLDILAAKAYSALGNDSKLLGYISSSADKIEEAYASGRIDHDQLCAAVAGASRGRAFIQREIGKQLAERGVIGGVSDVYATTDSRNVAGVTIYGIQEGAGKLRNLVNVLADKRNWNPRAEFWSAGLYSSTALAGAAAVGAYYGKRVVVGGLIGGAGEAVQEATGNETLAKVSQKVGSLAAFSLTFGALSIAAEGLYKAGEKSKNGAVRKISNIAGNAIEVYMAYAVSQHGLHALNDLDLNPLSASEAKAAGLEDAKVEIDTSRIPEKVIVKSPLSTAPEAAGKGGTYQIVLEDSSYKTTLTEIPADKVPGGVIRATFTPDDFATDGTQSIGIALVKGGREIDSSAPATVDLESALKEQYKGPRVSLTDAQLEQLFKDPVAKAFIDSHDIYPKKSYGITPQRPVELPSETFEGLKKIDSNQDGLVSQTEYDAASEDAVLKAWLGPHSEVEAGKRYVEAKPATLTLDQATFDAVKKNVDSNNDGSVSKEEYDKASSDAVISPWLSAQTAIKPGVSYELQQPGVMQLTAEDVKALRQHVDTNRDGFVSQGEYDKAYAGTAKPWMDSKDWLSPDLHYKQIEVQPVELNQERFGVVREKMDSDKDGFISKTEYEKALKDPVLKAWMKSVEPIVSAGGITGCLDGEPVKYVQEKPEVHQVAGDVYDSLQKHVDKNKDGVVSKQEYEDASKDPVVKTWLGSHKDVVEGLHYSKEPLPTEFLDREVFDGLQGLVKDAGVKVEGTAAEHATKTAGVFYAEKVGQNLGLRASPELAKVATNIEIGYDANGNGRFESGEWSILNVDGTKTIDTHLAFDLKHPSHRYSILFTDDAGTIYASMAGKGQVEPVLKISPAPEPEVPETQHIAVPTTAPEAVVPPSVEAPVVEPERAAETPATVPEPVATHKVENPEPPASLEDAISKQGDVPQPPAQPQILTVYKTTDGVTDLSLSVNPYPATSHPVFLVGYDGNSIAGYTDSKIDYREFSMFRPEEDGWARIINPVIIDKVSQGQTSIMAATVDDAYHQFNPSIATKEAEGVYTRWPLSADIVESKTFQLEPSQNGFHFTGGDIESLKPFPSEARYFADINLNGVEDEGEGVRVTQEFDPQQVKGILHLGEKDFEVQSTQDKIPIRVLYPGWQQYMWTVDDIIAWITGVTPKPNTVLTIP